MPTYPKPPSVICFLVTDCPAVFCFIQKANCRLMVLSFVRVVSMPVC